MEIILSIATVIGGVAAIWYFVDKYRDSIRPGEKAEQSKASVLPEPSGNSVDSPTHSASRSGESPLFISEPHTDINSGKFGKVFT